MKKIIYEDQLHDGMTIEELAQLLDVKPIEVLDHYFWLKFLEYKELQKEIVEDEKALEDKKNHYADLKYFKDFILDQRKFYQGESHDRK
jgi:hypothetical protein